MSQRMIFDDMQDQYAGEAKSTLTSESTAVTSIA